jgi:hypothetical protein
VCGTEAAQQSWWNIVDVLYRMDSFS